MVILAAGAGSTAYPQVLQAWAGTGCNDAGACTGPSQGLLNAAMVLLVIGVLGKSGMVPFHDWLPDAMEGPTPASALIHAATMVAAGTFVLAQLFDVLAAADGARWLLAVSTAVTMVYAAVLAFGQSDLKRLLAYSTLSQVALMLSALAVAPADEGPGAGVLHLYSHAFFKALLFLAIGWLSVTVGGTAAATMRGGVRGHLFIRPAMFVGLLSLAGVPPLVGFVSKEHVLAAAEAGAAGRPGPGLARPAGRAAHRRADRRLLHARLDRARRPRLGRRHRAPRRRHRHRRRSAPPSPCWPSSPSSAGSSW